MCSSDLSLQPVAVAWAHRVQSTQPPMTPSVRPTHPSSSDAAAVDWTKGQRPPHSPLRGASQGKDGESDFPNPFSGANPTSSWPPVTPRAIARAVVDTAYVSGATLSQPASPAPPTPSKSSILPDTARPVNIPRPASPIQCPHPIPPAKSCTPSPSAGPKAATPSTSASQSNRPINPKAAGLSRIPPPRQHRRAPADFGVVARRLQTPRPLSANEDDVTRGHTSASASPPFLHVAVGKVR